MMARQQTTLKRKLMNAIMATSITVLALTCVVFITYEYVTFRKSIVEGLITRAEIIAANSTAALAFQNELDAREVLSALRKDPRMVAACLYDKSGHVFAKYPAKAPTESFPMSPETQGYRFEKAHCVVFAPVIRENRWLGTVYLKSDLSAMSERFQLYAVLLLVVITGSIGVAFALSTGLQKRIFAPLLNLTDTARNVSEHRDYALRAEKLSDDEIGLLTDSFNHMLGQIQRRDASLRKTEEEIRKLNAELEQRVTERTAQLEATNKELEAFSYSVSHDLRAPLRSIDGFSQALLEDCADQVDENGKDSLRRIRAASQRMGQLIDDLLNLSRLSRGELRRQPVDLSAVAKTVAAELQERDPQREVEWLIANGLVTDGDPHLLRVMLDNLLGNAWKFTLKQPHAKIEVGCNQNNGTSAFFVRDNGAGFDMAYVDKLFGAFQRLHPAAEFSGTGIGLATVQRIISRHGGRVWAEGAVNKGATLYFTISSEKAAHGSQTARGISTR